MGFLDSGGQGAQAFTDSFLKTYMMLDENDRAKNAQKIAQQMAEAKLQEIAEAKQREANVIARLQAEKSRRAAERGWAGLMDAAAAPVQTGAKPTLANPSAGGDYAVYDPTGTVKSLPTSPQGLSMGGNPRAGLMPRDEDISDFGLDLAIADPRYVAQFLKKDTSNDALFMKALIAGNLNNYRNQSLDEKKRHNVTIEDLRRDNAVTKSDATTSKDTKESRKEQIKMFDDAISAYDKNIDTYRKIYEKATPGGKTAESMAKAINDNEQQRKIAIERKNAFMSGKKSSTSGKQPPAGFTDSGKTSGGKKVYIDGKGNAWLE